MKPLRIGFDPGIFNLDRMQVGAALRCPMNSEATVIPAPRLRVVHDVVVFSPLGPKWWTWVLRRCNLAGIRDNVVDFTLRTASPLTVGLGVSGICSQFTVKLTFDLLYT